MAFFPWQEIIPTSGFFAFFQCFSAASARLVPVYVANVLRLSRKTIFVLESYNVRVQSATGWTASVHTLHMSKPVITFVLKVLRNGLLRYIHMPKPVITFVFKVLRNGLLRYILYTCPNLWLRSCSKCYGTDCFGTYFTQCPNLWLHWCSKCYGMDCFGTYATHAETCDYVRVQSATEWTVSVHTLHMPKPVITFLFKVLRNGPLRYILYTCPNLWLRSCSKCYGMDCFGTYFTHAQTCDYVRVQSATERTASVHTLPNAQTCDYIGVQSATEWTASVHMLHATHAETCDYVRVQSATEWTASVHTLHMPKPVIMFLTFKVLRNGLLRYILYTCPPVITCVFKVLLDCFGTYVTHAQTCDYVRVQSATERTASVHTLYTCPNLWLRSCSKCYGMARFGT